MLRSIYANVLGLAAILTAPVLAQPAVKTQPLSTQQFSCHTAGSGRSYIKVCFSRHGNLVYFESPQGRQHIYAEGYTVCAGSNAYYDPGNGEWGWGEPTVSQPAPNRFPLKITRRTTDGKLQLVQTFSWDTAEKDLVISMDLKNVSSSSISYVTLDRYFDGDLDNSSTNVFDRSQDSVWGRKDNGLILVGLTDSQRSSVQSYFDFAPSRCGQASAPTSTEYGDWVGRLSVQIGTMAAGRTENIKFGYVRH